MKAIMTYIRIGLILLGLAGLLSSLEAQQALNVTHLSQTLTNFDNIAEITIQGNLAYVVHGFCGLTILDISNPVQPVEVGYYPLPEGYRAIAIDGIYAYIASYSVGLRVVNIANPAQPVEVGSLAMNLAANNISVSGNHLYVSVLGSGVKIFNVSDPTHPVFVTNLVYLSDVYTVTALGNYAYVTYDGDPPMPDEPNNDDLVFQVYNITVPQQPSLLGQFHTTGVAYSIVVQSSYAYLANGSYGLMVVDISNPAALHVEGSLATTSYVNQVAISGSYAYLANGENGVQVVSVSNPASPQSISFLHNHGTCNELTVTGNTVLASYAGLSIINAATPAAPTELTYYQKLRRPALVELAGDYLCVLDAAMGLRIFDKTDPNQLLETGSLQTGADATDIAVAGDLVYLAAGASGLKIINIADPAQPLLVGSYTASAVRYVAVAGQYAYVSSGGMFVDVLDMTSLTAPLWIGRVNLSNTLLRRMKIRGNYLYVCCDVQGMAIIDISDPNAMHLVSMTDTPGNVVDVDVSGDFAYVADSYHGMQIVNISNPASPSIVGNYSIDDILTQVRIEGEYTYLAYGWEGMYVIDIGNAQHPVLAGFFNTYGRSVGITVINRIAYVADFYSLDAFDCSLAVPNADPVVPINTDIVRLFPNPCYHSTSLTIELKSGSRAELTVYNVRGQRVKSIFSGKLSAGSTTCTWDGTDSLGQKVAGGVYFYRLKTEQATQSGKMLLLDK